MQRRSRSPGAEVIFDMDYTAEPPLVHYSTDSGKTYRIATVSEFERDTGCTVTFTERQA
jgi:hypothetical protein